MAEWIASLQPLFAIELFRSIGVREGIIIAVAIVIIYMLVMVLRIKSLTARRGLDELAAARYESDLMAAAKPPRKGRTDKDEREDREPALAATIVPGKERLDAYYDAPPRSEPKNKYFEPPEVDRAPERPHERVVASLDQEKLQRFERDLSATREELDALRSAFAETRERMQADIERLKAGQRVSPTYGDSLQMAMSGASAEDIAASCGIARAEAELVLSLVRGGGESVGGTEGAGAPVPVRSDDEVRNRRSRYGSY